MKIGVPKETAEGERRVALVPDVVKALTAKEIEVAVEPGAGAGARHSDDEFSEAGARVNGDVWGSDVLLKVTPPTGEEVGRLKRGQILIGFLQPLTNPDLAKSLAEQGVTSFAMESIPRITRAQSMDALSSQANLGGYMSVLIAEHGGAGRASGAPIGTVSGYLYRVRDGKIVRAELYPGRAEALEAASLPGWSEPETD